MFLLSIGKSELTARRLSDIAGPAFLDRAITYYGKGGTGVGVRLLTHFLTAQSRA